MLHEFSYIKPTSMDELLGFLAAEGENSSVFSGGTDLFVNIRAGVSAPSYVVDLKRVPELQELGYDKSQGLSIGACVTVNQLVEDEAAQSHYPILVEAGTELATYQLRNRATVIGNIVTASPCGDMTSPLLCLGAEVVLTSKRGSRQMALGEFITGVKTTQIASDEIVTKIVVPTKYIDAVGGYKKLKRIKGHDLGVVAVVMIKTKDVVRVAISSAAPTPVLLEDFSLETPFADIQKAAQTAISPIDDVRCTREYRSFMVDVYIRRLAEEVAD